jgi:BirA family transcriptional regulator, biotin operon repressor / biotin---[acetyl-CoA-carboxylase] ligase
MNPGSTHPSDINLPPAYRLIEMDSVGSSNDEAKSLADAGAEEGTLVWAHEQTKGRGRHGRTWNSPRGNLYLSLILRPECALAEAAQLGFVAALAVGDAIGAVAPPMLEVTYKWPNDVLVHGRKVAGLLLESKSTADGALEWLILGVGVNVQSHPNDARFPATNLIFESVGPEVNEAVMLEAFSRHFLTWVNRWTEDGFEPIRRAWLSHAHGLGEAIEVRLGKETVRGTFKDLDESGALILELPNAGRRVITAGDILFAA